jgi:hypothetical protein
MCTPSAGKTLVRVHPGGRQPSPAAGARVWIGAPRRVLFQHDTEFKAGDVDLDAPGALAEVHRRLAYDGLLVQCAGRGIRAAPGKDTAEVHDYHDVATPVLAASLQRRMPGYRTLGFTAA